MSKWNLISIDANFLKCHYLWIPFFFLIIFTRNNNLIISLIYTLYNCTRLSLIFTSPFSAFFEFWADTRIITESLARVFPRGSLSKLWYPVVCRRRGRVWNRRLRVMCSRSIWNIAKTRLRAFIRSSRRLLSNIACQIREAKISMLVKCHQMSYYISHQAFGHIFTTDMKFKIYV